MAVGKRKAAAAAAAVGVAAALAFGGTFAWQSISQGALNEASDIVNPGGRLHDDFNGTNKDVYVENFADEPIIARIRLGEYFEVISNYGVEGAEKSIPILGGKDEDGAYTYETFKNYASLAEGAVAAGVDGTYSADAAEGDAGYAWWTWQTGGSTVYMPTFNMNKDSLEADINGIYEEGNVGAISDRVLDLMADGAQYSDYVEYAEGETLEGVEIYDADANSVDEFDDGTATLGVTYKEVSATHTAKLTENATLMSMQEWVDAGSKPGPYWVYDTDGWVYWAQAIEPDTATGLLLDSIELNQVMDDTWYYAINVEAQFVTPDDVGASDGTGFYVEGTEPSSAAEALLLAIGVELPASDPPVHYRLSSSDEIPAENAKAFVNVQDMLAITYVRMGDPIPVEELKSSYFLDRKLTSNTVPPEEAGDFVGRFDGGEVLDPGDGSLLAYQVSGFGPVVVYADGGCELTMLEGPDTPITFTEPGVYLPHLAVSDEAAAQGLELSIETELYEFTPDPESVRREYVLSEDITATLTWGGTLTVSGEGEMPDYSVGQKDAVDSYAPWYDDGIGLTSVIIEEGVTSLSDFAFYNMTNLESATLPASVESIGVNAFQYCSALSSIDVPEDLVSIGDGAFSGCTSLASVDIPDAVTSIGANAFWNCESLTSVAIPGAIGAIPDYAFMDCSSLESVVISSGVTSIGQNAFFECSALESVVVPDTVVSIEADSFYNCTTVIYYTGTQEQWDQIDISQYALPDGVTVSYDYVTSADVG